MPCNKYFLIVKIHKFLKQIKSYNFVLPLCVLNSATQFNFSIIRKLYHLKISLNLWCYILFNQIFCKNLKKKKKKLNNPANFLLEEIQYKCFILFFYSCINAQLFICKYSQSHINIEYKK